MYGEDKREETGYNMAIGLFMAVGLFLVHRLIVSTVEISLFGAVGDFSLVTVLYK